MASKYSGKPLRTSEKSKHFFNRIANVWNSLLEQIVKSNSGETFKSKVDSYLIGALNLIYLELIFFPFIDRVLLAYLISFFIDFSAVFHHCRNPFAPLFFYQGLPEGVVGGENEAFHFTILDLKYVETIDVE